jgi:hypothetical protein
MDEAFQLLLNELSKLAADSESATPSYGEGREDWGGQSPESRLKIRESIADTLGDLTGGDIEDLRELSGPPRPHLWCVSISHTLDWGGWMAIRRPTQIGWDIELKERIRLPLVERVCSEAEVVEAPLAALLWCAKEAFYKALEDEQPPTIVSLTITDWEACGEGQWTWRGLGPRNGQGLILEVDRWLLAGCVVR